MDVLLRKAFLFTGRSWITSLSKIALQWPGITAWHYDGPVLGRQWIGLQLNEY